MRRMFVPVLFGSGSLGVANLQISQIAAGDWSGSTALADLEVSHS